MNTLKLIKKNRLQTHTLVLASALLFTACSQQQTAIPAATGGINSAGSAGGNGSGSANANANNGGSNTQGANVGNGGGTLATGGGSGGYGAGNGQGSHNQGGGSGGATAGKDSSAITLGNLNNPDSLLSRRIIYFDYNMASIKPQYRAILDAHTKLLAKNPSVRVRLEGHADERGTREYNVALSEERAKSIQRTMRGKGVQASQAEIIAYGEERPAKVGDGEKSWAQNRRVEIKYLGR